jgi:hypothetical protein
MDNSNKLNSLNLNYSKLQGSDYKNTNFFSNLKLEEKIRELKKKNIDMFKFLNTYLVDEIKRNSVLQEISTGSRSNSIILEDLKNIKLFNDTPQNKINKPKEIEALTQEELLFKRIYNRQLNNIMQVKDYNINPSGILTKDQIRKSMARFFNKGDMNKKIMNIKNKMYLMKGMIDFSLPEINVDFFKHKTNDFRKSDGRVLEKNRKYKLSSLERKSNNFKINIANKSKSLLNPEKITKLKLQVSNLHKKNTIKEEELFLNNDKDDSILNSEILPNIGKGFNQKSASISKSSLDNTIKCIIDDEKNVIQENRNKNTVIKFILQDTDTKKNNEAKKHNSTITKLKTSILINQPNKNSNNKKSIKFVD